MNTHDIESITELQVRRVLRVMRVYKLIILDLHAGHTAGCNQVIAVPVVGRLIYIR